MNTTEFKKSALKHAAAVGTIITFMIGLVSFMGWWFGDAWKSEHGNIAIVHAGYCAVILYLLWFILSRASPNFLGTPVVRAIHDKSLLLVEGAPWLSLGVMAAIYTKENDYERLVCTGEVINVQTNSLVQVSIREVDEAFGDLEAVEKKLAEINKEFILIRPGLFRRGSQ